MLDLRLREEFRGKRLKGTAIELSNDASTGATQIAATSAERLELIGVDHPIIHAEIDRWQDLTTEKIGVSVQAKEGISSIITLWKIESSSAKGSARLLYNQLQLR